MYKRVRVAVKRVPDEFRRLAAGTNRSQPIVRGRSSTISYTRHKFIIILQRAMLY